MPLGPVEVLEEAGVVVVVCAFAPSANPAKAKTKAEILNVVFIVLCIIC